MKTLVLILLCALTVPGQKIDGKKIDKWTPIVVSTPDLGITFYFAPESIKRNGDHVIAWTRTDFDRGSGVLLPNTDYYSIRIFVDFDCANNRSRSHDVLFFNSAGKLTKSGQDNDWAKEEPGKFSWAMFEYLCERRAQFPTQPPKLKAKP